MGSTVSRANTWGLRWFSVLVEKCGWQVLVITTNSCPEIVSLTVLSNGWNNNIN
jgi:hypothetical protein